MKKTLVSIRLDLEVIYKLKYIAEKDKRSQGQKISLLIEKEFDRVQKEDNEKK